MTCFPPTLTSSVSDLGPLAVDPHGKGGSLRFEAPAGLYQVSVVADARAFDWDTLYIRLNRYHNDNVLTGPWDFNLLDDNKPLVPAYWVELDGRRLGLWCFQRVSLDDLAHRRFRGRMAFRLAEGGTHALQWEPYRDVAVEWISARLEADSVSMPPFSPRRSSGPTAATAGSSLSCTSATTRVLPCARRRRTSASRSSRGG